MLVRRSVLSALAASVLAAGCGGGDAETTTQASPGDVPGITTPRSEREYENGGADGSGADGVEAEEQRGGIAAGSDHKEPGDSEGADTRHSPPRGGQLEDE